METKYTDEYMVANAPLNRLLNEYEKYGSICIAFDFDNTVAIYDNQTATYSQVIQLIKDFSVHVNCRIVCWTANPFISYVNKFLTENEIPFDSINGEGITLSYESRKPVFSALLDDRCGLREVYDYLSEFLEIIKAKNETKKQDN
jgi:hypothetical protein